MKQIITIQHTQSIHHTNGMVGSWTDWDLSELGIEQAERIGQKLAKQLSGHKIVMYASDLLRAKHTAEIVAKHMGRTAARFSSLLFPTILFSLPSSDTM